MARGSHILILLALALVVAPDSTAVPRKKRPSDGTYTLKVAGYIRGQGNAVVTSGQDVRLTLVVARVNPPRSAVAAGSVTVTLKPKTPGNNHVVGDQVLLGKLVHFEGRLDVPDDAKERAIRGVRLVCRIRSPDGYASVIGYIPALANAEDAIDKGKDKGNDDDDEQ